MILIEERYFYQILICDPHLIALENSKFFLPASTCEKIFVYYFCSNYNTINDIYTSDLKS
jgi:hypothetical protein